MSERMLQETHDAVLRIEGRLKAGDKRMDQIEERQEKHDHALFGNGKPGLVEVVGDLRKNWSFWKKLAWAAVGAMMPLVGGGAAAAVLYLVRHVPAAP